MNSGFSINPTDGSVQVDGCASVIREGLASEVVLANLLPFHSGTTDHKNGYVWLRFERMTFGGQPCLLSICFHLNKLTELNWAVTLPNSRADCELPTRDTIDAEINFVRSVMSSMLSITFWSGSKRFKWGEVWSTFDPREVVASSGLRYAV